MKKEFTCPTDFNVYQLDYPKDFIDKLPVDFDKMKNKDLSDVPELYKCLFLTDWNWGAYSKMNYEDRVFCNDLFLEYNNYCVLKSIFKKKNINTEGMDRLELRRLYKEMKDK